MTKPATAGRKPARQTLERVAELRRLVEHHSWRYYVLDDPEISDEAYDALFDELRRLEAEHPQLVDPQSPTQRVAPEPVGRLEKVAHLEPMLSLGNVRSEQEMRAWVSRMQAHLAREGIVRRRFQYVVEPKVDGLAVQTLRSIVHALQLVGVNLADADALKGRHFNLRNAISTECAISGSRVKRPVDEK